MATDTLRCSSAVPFSQNNQYPANKTKDLFTTNTKLTEEIERLKEENLRLKRENSKLQKHARYHEENAQLAQRDIEHAFSRQAEAEAQLDIVKQLLRRYQHTEMQEVSQRRRQALEYHRVNYEATRPGGDVVGEPWVLNEGEGRDEIDSGVGMDPHSPLILSLPDSSTSSGNLPPRYQTAASSQDEVDECDTCDSVEVNRSRSEMMSRSDAEMRSRADLMSRSEAEMRSRFQVNEDEGSGYDVV